MKKRTDLKGQYLLTNVFNMYINQLVNFACGTFPALEC